MQLSRKGSAHFSSSGISIVNEIRLRGKIKINIDRNAVVLIWQKVTHFSAKTHSI